MSRDLKNQIEPVLKGRPHIEVVEALASLLGQAIADQVDTPEGASVVAEAVGRAIGKDIAKNWPLVTARRKRQAQ